MINSMTGYAHSSRNYTQFDLDIEIKSVNHRYLNLVLKIPEEFRFLEHKVNALLSKHVSRGKIECRINVNLNQEQNKITLNNEIANQLIELNKKLIRETHLESLTVADLLKFPGVIAKNELNFEKIESILLTQIQETCTEFNLSRQREGKNLKEHLELRIEKIETIVNQILSTQHERVEQYINKLTEKIYLLLASTIESERLNQEIALYIQKIDIDEELSRLKSHINETKRLLAGHLKYPIGKRLDFMMQELNRETNTLASKSNQAELTQATIELKVLIEQMREQIQNIE